MQLGGGQKPIKQAGATDLNTNALHYLYATLLRAIAEKTNDPPKTKEHPVLDSPREDKTHVRGKLSLHVKAKAEKTHG